MAVKDIGDLDADRGFAGVAGTGGSVGGLRLLSVVAKLVFQFLIGKASNRTQKSAGRDVLESWRRGLFADPFVVLC